MFHILQMLLELIFYIFGILSLELEIKAKAWFRKTKPIDNIP